MKVTIYRDMREEKWPSMDRYADRVVAGLRNKESGSVLPRECEIDRVSLPLLPQRLSLYYTRNLLYPRLARKCQGQVNHIIDHSYGHLVYALDPSRTIVTCHDLYPLAHGDSLPVLRLATVLWKHSLNGTLKAARIVCDSEFTRKELLRLTAYPAERTRVVPLGVESAFKKIENGDSLNGFRVGLGLEKGPLLLHVGHCGERKNIEGLLQILAIVRSGHSDVRLLQVGGRFTTQQRNVIKQLMLEGSVVQLPQVNEEDLVRLYNISDVLVFPSLYEGFGFPPLEAMACGLPVVTSAVASLPEVVGNAAIVLAPNDLQGFAEAVIGVLSQENVRKPLVDAGLKRAAMFSWEDCISGTLAIYEEVFEQRGMATQ